MKHLKTKDKLTIKEIIDIGQHLNLEYYNETKESVCFMGVNGYSSLFQKDSYYNTMSLFSKHLQQMGRDSLKMDLNHLLNITKHH